MKTSAVLGLTLLVLLVAPNGGEGRIVKRSGEHDGSPWEFTLYKMFKMLQCYHEQLLRILAKNPQAVNDVRVLLTSMGWDSDTIDYVFTVNLIPVVTSLLHAAEEDLDASISYSPCPCSSSSSSESGSSGDCPCRGSRSSDSSH